MNHSWITKSSWPTSVKSNQMFSWFQQCSPTPHSSESKPASSRAHAGWKVDTRGVWTQVRGQGPHWLYSMFMTANSSWHHADVEGPHHILIQVSRPMKSHKQRDNELFGQFIGESIDPFLQARDGWSMPRKEPGSGYYCSSMTRSKKVLLSRTGLRGFNLSPASN